MIAPHTMLHSALIRDQSQTLILTLPLILAVRIQHHAARLGELHGVCFLSASMHFCSAADHHRHMFC